MLTNYSSEAYCEKNVIKLLIFSTITFWASKWHKTAVLVIFCNFLQAFVRSKFCWV